MFTSRNYVVRSQSFDWRRIEIYHFIPGFQDRERVRSTASSRQGAGADRVPGNDRQISHLSALLAESEAQNGRLEKLTEVC